MKPHAPRTPSSTKVESGEIGSAPVDEGRSVRPSDHASPTRTSWRAAIDWDWLTGTVLAEGLALVVIVVARGSVLGSIARATAVALFTILALRATSWSGRSRGVVGVSTGLIGLVVGVGIGASHLVRAGLSSTSLAGVVSLGCGVAFLCSGTVVLVRAASGWHKLLAIPIAFVLFQFVAVPLFAALVITNVPPDEVGATTPGDHGLPFEEVTFRTADGVDLAGWYVPSSNRAALVMLAGSGSTRSGVLDHAVVLAQHGYGTLIMDNRGHGRSGGIAMDTGWFGDLDIAGAIDFLRERPDVDPGLIGVLGLSMGGEEAIGATGTDARIAAVVAEGATARDSLDHGPSAGGVQGWIEQVTTWEQFRLADLLTDAASPTALRDAVVAANPRPVLLIAGQGEEEANRRFRDASPRSVALWELPNTPHVGALATNREEWEQRVLAFLDDALLPP